MAFKIIWSQQAVYDLGDIVSLIAEDNRAVAESFGFRLMSKVDALAQFPRLGRIVPEEQNEDVREVFLPPYRIIYRVIEKDCLTAIVRVWHGERGQPEIPSNPNF